MAKLKLPFELEKPSANEYVTRADQIGYGSGSAEDALKKTDNISNSSTQSENDEIRFETDNGTLVGMIDANGADFTNLKRGGVQVARTSDIPSVPTLDTSIGNSPSNSHTPSTKAVKDYVDANKTTDKISDLDEEVDTEEVLFASNNESENYASVGSYGIKAKAYYDNNGKQIKGVESIPVTHTETQEESEEQIWSNEGGNDIYVKISNYGIKVKNITDLNGNPIGGDIDYTNIVNGYASKYTDILNDLKRGSDFNALFFSDIHGRSEELQRIVQYGNAMKNSLDCIIDGGDDTQSFTSTTPITWFDTDIANSELPCLRAVGNHDAWSSDYWVWDTNQNIYTMMTSKVVADLTSRGITVVQPSDVATTYKNYYYVDFGNVRVVVLLCLILSSHNAYWDAAQKNWLESVLDDALTNDKHVLIVNHGALDPASIKECETWPNWNSPRSWERYTTQKEPYCHDTQHLSDEAITLVDSFISDGGNFIAYIAGHTHTDFVLETKNATNKQFCVVTSCAKSSPSDSYTPALGKLNFDLFNWISIDTTNCLFKMLRLGNGQTRAMNDHSIIVIDYRNAKILASK